MNLVTPRSAGHRVTRRAVLRSGSMLGLVGAGLPAVGTVPAHAADFRGRLPAGCPLCAGTQPQLR